MSFVPPPFVDDVEGDFGPYNPSEIIGARMSLLQSMQRENNPAWRSIKYKLGILPNGHRLHTHDNLDHVWLPPQLPDLWSAPVVLHDPSASDRTPERTGPGYEEERRHQQGGRDKNPDSSGADANFVESSPRSSRLNESSLSDCMVVESQLSNPIVIESPPSNSASMDPPSSSSAWFDSPPTTSSGMGGEGDANDFRFILDESDEEPEYSGDVDDDSGTASRKKRKRDKGTDGDHPERSSKRAKEDVAKQQIYVTVFQCDLCNFFHRNKDRVQQHLQQSGHYSGSRYLGMIVGEGEAAELYLVFLSKSCILVEPDNVFREKVASCPVCHNVYISLERCMQHCLSVHKDRSMYSFRKVIYSTTFNLVKDSNQCTDCGQNFPDNDLKAHIAKTQHMELALGEKSAHSSMVFLCPFCQGTNFNYLGFKTHVFEKHARETQSQSAAPSALCCIIGESQPPSKMLPRDPGIPINHIINHNYSDSKFTVKCGYNPRKRKVEALPLKHLELPLVLKLKNSVQFSQSKLHSMQRQAGRRAKNLKKKEVLKKKKKYNKKQGQKL